MKTQITALTAILALVLTASAANAQKPDAGAKDRGWEAGAPERALERREEAREREDEARQNAREREDEAREEARKREDEAREEAREWEDVTREQSSERGQNDTDQARGGPPDSAPGHQKQRDNVAERERREEGKGSEQGQEKRKEKSRKWWRFWE